MNNRFAAHTKHFFRTFFVASLVCLFLVKIWSVIRPTPSDIKSIDTPNRPKFQPPETVLIKAGAFKMGDIFGLGEADEKPTHEVKLNDFQIGKYEVTLAEFKVFVDAEDYQTDAEKRTYGYGSHVHKGKTIVDKAAVNWRHDAAGNVQTDPGHPVIHVSHNDAIAYCEWASRMSGKTYRLPTEAEWEYVALSLGKEYRFAWGNGNPSLSNGGNVADETKSPEGIGWSLKFSGYDDGYWLTAPVGRFGANEVGIYDMTGNVWEWCADWYGSDYYQNSPVDNPEGPATGTHRVLRGGSWGGGQWGSRATIRRHDRPGDRSGNASFRLVVSPQR